MKFFGFVKMQTFLLECEICDNFLFLFLFFKEKKILNDFPIYLWPRSYGDAWSKFAESE